MIQIIISYLKFLWNSKNEHGVHSPFVFLLVTKCFYNKSNFAPYFPNLETKTKKGKFLNRLFHYFQFQEGINISDSKKNIPSKVDYIYIDSTYSNNQNTELESIIDLANNETCIIFETPIILNQLKYNGNQLLQVLILMLQLTPIHLVWHLFEKNK